MARPTSNIERRRAGRSAFTLAESLLASVVLAVSVIGIAGALMAGYGQTSAQQRYSTAVALARQLLEEIAAKPYLDPTNGSYVLGSAAGETTRATFNHVGNYHGYSDTTSSLSALSGQSLSIGNGTYTRSVAVEYRGTPSGSAVSTGDFALITVTVRTPKNESVVLRRMVSNTPQAF